MEDADVTPDDVLIAIYDKLQDKRARTVDFFRDIDLSGDGTVSPEEFRAGLVKFGFTPTDAEFRALMSELDRDGDHEINYQEFDKAIKKVAKSAKAKNRAARLKVTEALKPDKDLFTHTYLTQMLEKVQKQSHFFHDFASADVKTIAEHACGCIAFDPGQVILPPDTPANWVGLIMKGNVEIKHKHRADEHEGQLKVGSYVRAHEFLEGYYNVTHKAPPKLKGQVLKMQKGSLAIHKRNGALVHSPLFGADHEYLQGGTTKGVICCWDYDAMTRLREARPALANTYMMKLGHAQISDMKERVHALVSIEKKSSSDDVGTQGAAIRKQMEAMASKEKKLLSQLQKAREAQHSAKNEKMLKAGLERQLEELRKRVAKKEESDREAEAKAAQQKKKAQAALAQLASLKKVAEQEKAQSKKKLDSLRKLMEKESAKKAKAAQAVLKKKLKAQESAIAAKAKEKMDAALARAQAEQRAAVMLHEEEKAELAKKLEDHGAQHTQLRKVVKQQKAQSAWVRIRLEQKEKADKKRRNQAQFQAVMQAASVQKLKRIREEAVEALKNTQSQLNRHVSQNAEYEDMLEDAEKMQNQMMEQVSTMMKLISKTKAESSQLAQDLQAEKSSRSKAKWKNAGQKLKDEKMQNLLQDANTRLDVARGVNEELSKKLTSERSYRAKAENRVMKLDTALDSERMKAEHFRGFAMLQGMYLGCAINRQRRRLKLAKAKEEELVNALHGLRNDYAQQQAANEECEGKLKEARREIDQVIAERDEALSKFRSERGLRIAAEEEILTCGDAIMARQARVDEAEAELRKLQRTRI
eukprot:g3445.t1